MNPYPLVKIYNKKKLYALDNLRQIVKKQHKKIITVEDTFYYIPILDTLEVQLSSPKLLKMVMEALKNQPILKYCRILLTGHL